MKAILVILLTFVSLENKGQDLRFVVNVGHQSTIIHFEEGLNGTIIFTGSTNEIIKREVYSGKVLKTHVSDGKYEAISLSEDRSELIAFETRKNGYHLNIWNATTDQLITSINILKLLPEYPGGEVKGIKYYKSSRLIVWITTAHLYVFNISTNHLAIDPGFQEGGRFVREVALGDKQIFVYCSEFNLVKDRFQLYAVNVEGLASKPTALVRATNDSVVKIYPIPGTDTLVVIKWNQVDLLNTKAGSTKTIPIANNEFTVLYNCTATKDPFSTHLKIASNGKLLDLDLANNEIKVISFAYPSFERSAFSAYNPDVLFAGGNEKLLSYSIKKQKLLKAYDDVSLDDPTDIFITTDNKLVCESRYTNAFLNILNLNNLSFRQIESEHSNNAYGTYISPENSFAKIVVDYSTSEKSKSAVTYLLVTRYLDNDSTEALNLNKLINPDSLSYPRFEITADYRYYLLFSKNMVYGIDRKQKKLAFQFLVPMKQSGYATSVRRPVLFLKDRRHAVMADLNIVLVDLLNKKIAKVIRDDPGEYQSYFTAVLDHDSTNLFYLKNNWLYTYEFTSDKTDTIGYFGWVRTFKPVKLNGVNQWVLGYDNGDVEIRDQTFKKILKNAKLHQGRVNELLFDAPKARIITVGADGHFSFLDVNTFKPILKGCFLSTRKYRHTNVFLIDNSNQYYLSANLTNAIHVVSGNKAFDYISLDPLLNRPDIIANTLKADNNIVHQLQAAYTLRKQRMKAGDLDQFYNLPRCSIIRKEMIPYSVDSNNISLLVRYQQTKYPIRKIYVKDNNVISNVVKLPTNAKLSDEVTINIHLLKKTNHVQVFAEDSEGNRSLYESFDIECNKKGSSRGKLIFIGIGISNYMDSTKSLSFAAKDIQDVADSFDRLSFNSDIILTLTDSTATAAEVRKLDNLLGTSRPEDKVIFYFSGHGIRTDSGFFFCLYDTDFKNISNTAFALEELLAMFENSPARKRLLFIDACQSGDAITLDELRSLTSNNILTNDRLQEKGSSKINSQILEFYNSYFTNLSSDKGVQIIAASYGNDPAVERLRLNNGIFTFCFKKGLFDKEAYPGSPYSPKASLYPNISELRTYLYSKVSSISNGKQLPSTVLLDPYNEWDFQDIFPE